MSILYLPDSVPKTKTRKQLLKYILTNGGVESFEDEKCSVLQCRKGAYRSITDLHMIVKSRFKITSLNSVIKAIKEIIEEDSCVVMVYCTQVNKVVLRYNKNTNRSYLTDYSRKNFYKTKGVDGYSLEWFEEQMNNM